MVCAGMGNTIQDFTNLSFPGLSLLLFGAGSNQKLLLKSVNINNTPAIAGRLHVYSKAFYEQLS